MHNPTQTALVHTWHQDHTQTQQDTLIEEVPVALVFNGISHVVMMITPTDIKAFATGFSLTEGIIHSPAEILDLEIVQQEQGLEILITLTARRFAELKQLRRNLTGRTGCGLCGAESLTQAIRNIAPLPKSIRPSDQAIQQAVTQLNQFQPLQQLTGACHGAAWCDHNGNLLFAKEDVGRHNALDKLIGDIALKKLDPTQGFVLISSRASYEMVQKVAAIGINTLVSVSAPTAFAVNIAQKANLNLIGFARTDRHVVYAPSNQA